MKKTKLLIPLLITTGIAPAISSFTSCSKGNETHSVVLYSAEGTFANKQQFITLTSNGSTNLSSLNNYVEPTLSNKQFVGWTDEDGKFVSENDIITKDTLLVANYDEKATTPVAFHTDSWPTVINVINKGYVEFAKAYCGYEGNDEDEAIGYIKLWMVGAIQTESKPIIPLDLTLQNGVIRAYVHPIDLAYDTITGTEEKAKFTFEFYDLIDVCLYNNDKEFKYWYKAAEGDKAEQQAFLRKYLNDNIFNELPVVLRREIKTVDKYSPDIKFNAGMMTNAPSPYIIEDIKVTEKSPERLFPLSCIENDAWLMWTDLPVNFDPASFEGYWFYDYLSSVMGIDYMSQQFLTKPAAESWNPKFDNPLPSPRGEGLYADYWLRNNSLTYSDEDLPEETLTANALAMYVPNAWNPSVAYPCPGSSFDVATGVAPAFCI